MKKSFAALTLATAVAAAGLSLQSSADELSDAVAADYDAHLGDLFVYFHQNPELSFMEQKTARRLADELLEAGFEVTEGVGGTGVVAMMENGPGPLIMMRADMDGLPVQEKSGLEYASTAKQVDPNGNEVFVMHACGHDVHITGLVGTARQMAARRDEWSGTLVLITQPAEELGLGAMMMLMDGLYDRFVLKAFIPIGFGLMLFAGLGLTAQKLIAMFGKRLPHD